MLVRGSREGLVSVIMPVYNAEKFIESSIQSVLAQTYKDFEIILINDGSTDGTQAVLEKYRNRRNIKIVERENKGIVRTLNEAVSLSEGKYLMRMDADDISLPYRMDKQLVLLKKEGLDIAGSAIKTFGGLYNYTRKRFTEDEKMKFQLLFASCFAHPTVFCKREVLATHGYDAEWEKIEDYELWTRLAKAGIRMGNSEDVLLKYRLHKKQITSVSRKYQDQKRSQISQEYTRFFFNSDQYRGITQVLLSREFEYLNTDTVSQLKDYYGFLVDKYPVYADIVRYQFFLCFVHNYFDRVKAGKLLQNIQFNNKKLVLMFNAIPYTKKLPAYAYQLIF